MPRGPDQPPQFRRHEPCCDLVQAEARAAVALVKHSTAAEVRRLLTRQYGRGSPVLKAFDTLRKSKRTAPRVDRSISGGEREEILRLRAKQWPPSKIAAELGLRLFRVSAYLRQVQNLGPAENLSKATTMSVLAALERGDKTVDEIALAYGCSRSSVLRLRKRLRGRLLGCT